MAEVLSRIGALARAKPRRLLLAEGDDERVVTAAARLAKERIAGVTLIAEPATAHSTAARAGVSLEGVTLLNPEDAESIARTAAELNGARADRLGEDERRRLSRDPVFQAAARVRLGLADCLIAGATRTTAEVVRAALWLIGTAPGVSAVSSYFLMVLPRQGERPERVLAFADCGVVPDPGPAQLAEIACLAADNFERLSGQAPRVAFLSFSTHGSADHPRVLKVRQAVELARVRRPDREFDGELQADAALDAGVAARKAPGSRVAGVANVLIFPDLDAGNIGYKLAQRLGGAEAYGPILQGLSRPANDLSRGCSTDDVVHVATIACASAGD